MSKIKLRAREIILKKKILALKDLPTLPATILEVIRLLGEEEPDFHRINRVLASDPVLITKILKMINSSLYALPQKVTSPDQAIALLGLTKLKELIFSTSVMDIVSSADEELWDHSFNVATIIGQIVRSARLPVPEDIGITALVHDIGRVVLSIFNPEGYRIASSKSRNENLPMEQCEREVFDITHALAGSWLLETWSMDPSVYGPVFFHHSPEKCPQEYAAVVYLIRCAEYIDDSLNQRPLEEIPVKLAQLAGFEIDLDQWMEWAENISVPQ